MNGEHEGAEEALAFVLADFDDALAAGRVADDQAVTALPATWRAEARRDLDDLRLVRELLGRPAPASPAPALPWVRLGRFELRRELGRGAAGIVYLAHDPLLGREVALKVPRPEVTLTPELRQRFRREARAAAGLDHPGIVRVLEAGEVGPVCYLVCEFCPGETLAGWLSRQTIPVPACHAAELVAALADAVGHAHARGVIHRDLKPANILLPGEPGRPAGAGTPSPGSAARPAGAGTPGPDGTGLARLVPKITDFGLAKLLEEAGTQGATRSGTLLGTVAYMPPEQAAGHAAEVGPAADVYALGAILYECLTGRPPFRGESELDTLRQIQTEEPLPPECLRPGLPRDLTTICLRALAREPARRYPSAAELASDLRRFLAGEPIHARPVGAAERALRWMRRHPSQTTLALLAVLTLVALVALTVGALFHGRLADAYDETRRALDAETHARAGADEARQDEKRQAQNARAETARANAYLYLHRILVAHAAWDDGQVARARRLLADCPEPLRQWEWHYLDRLCDAGQQTLRGHTQAVLAVSASPDGARLASASLDGTVRLWESKTGRALLTLPAHKNGVNCIAFSGDGRSLASGGNDHTVRVWDAVPLPADGLPAGRQTAGWVPRRVLDGFPAHVLGVAWSHDGRRLAVYCGDVPATAGTPAIHVREAADGREVFRLKGLRYGLRAVAFSPDGAWLAAAGADKRVLLWDARTGSPGPLLGGPRGAVLRLAFSPDGRHLAGTNPGGALLWDVPRTNDQESRNGDSARPPKTILKGHDGDVLSIAFARDGKLLATASLDQTVRVWDAASGEELFALRGHAHHVRDVTFLRDGRLASASADQSIKIWDGAAQEARTLARHSHPLVALALSPDGSLLAEAATTPGVWARDLVTGRASLLAVSRSGNLAVCFSPDGRTLACAGRDRQVELWDLRTGSLVRCLEGHTGVVTALAFTPDGRVLISASRDRALRFWDVRTGRCEQTIPGQQEVSSVSIAPDGTLVAVTAGVGVKILRVRDGRLVRSLTPHGNLVSAVAFSPDGQLLATAAHDRRVVLTRVETGRQVFTLEGHTLPVGGLAWHPSGRRLASGATDGRVCVWDVQLGELALALQAHRGPVRALLFSRDGASLFTAGEDRLVKRWEATVSAGFRHPFPVRFCPDRLTRLP